MKNNDEEFLDRKQNRRKKLQNKDHKRPCADDDYIINKKNRHNIKEKKEHLDEEEWEDWDRYYNH
jgi:hypothetical protein